MQLLIHALTLMTIESNQLEEVRAWMRNYTQDKTMNVATNAFPELC